MATSSSRASHICLQSCLLRLRPADFLRILNFSPSIPDVGTVQCLCEIFSMMLVAHSFVELPKMNMSFLILARLKFYLLNHFKKKLTLAETSKFLDCDFCGKEAADATAGEVFEELANYKWKVIDDYNGKEIGTWNEYRLVVIRSAEIELERIPKRRYDFYSEVLGKKLYLFFEILNFKYVARNVFFPIIYRFFLIAIVLICLASLIVIIADSEFEWLIKGFAIADLVLLVLMALFECNAIKLFTNQLITKFGDALSLTAIFIDGKVVLQVLHLGIAVVVSVLATREKYEEQRVVVILYIVTAFLHDIYRYLVNVLVIVCAPLIFLWFVVEYLVACKLCAGPCVVSLGKCTDDELKVCLVCKDHMIKGEDLVYLSCDEEHVFHKECLTEICREIERCPRSKSCSYQIVHIEIKE
eukprot:TRINITY_DN12728_c0_g1_i1.p1 TRINITY_DN12728_c0_g1~~TRINITY_DN12728_c0_g1_i1.p1  ORF type:complete len:414 (+),score=8.56 TRINITY_DN12728_c0_g1_i1:78-1319(+)